MSLCAPSGGAIGRIYTTMRGRTLKTPRIPGLFAARSGKSAAADEKGRETENRNAISIFSLLPFPPLPSWPSPNLLVHFGFEVIEWWCGSQNGTGQHGQRHGPARTSLATQNPKPSTTSLFLRFSSLFSLSPSSSLVFFSALG